MNMNKESYTAFDIAFEDNQFLKAEHNRGLRLMLEYEKPELALQEAKIKSMIVAFGSARILSPEQVKMLEDVSHTKEQIEHLEMRRAQVKWYDMAREFGKIAATEGGSLKPDHDGWLHNVIATGGGPGLMEATNRGASEAGAKSVGFNIYLPHEKEPNPYSTPELTFRFHYFAIRKMHLVIRANAMAVFPGGFGTLDEIMELLNLISTARSPSIPIVLFDKAFWDEVVNVPALLKHGLISKTAMDLIHYADSAREGFEIMKQNGLKI